MAPPAPRARTRARARRSRAVVAVVSALVATVLPAAASGATTALAAFGTAPARPGRLVGTAPASTPVTLDLVLRPGDTAGERAAVGDWLARAGVTARTVGGALHVVAPAGRLSRLLDTTFATFDLAGASSATGTAYAATSRPELPAAIAGDLDAVLGLSDAPVATASEAVLPGSRRTWVPTSTKAVQPDGALQADGAVTAPTPCSYASQIASSSGASTLNAVGDHYGVGSLLAGGHGGAGVTIAAIELAPSSASDIGAYDTCFGLSPANYHVEAVDGGAPVDQHGTVEADVDVEQLQTQAPQATVISYEGPNSSAGFYDTLAAAVDADEAQVISISWGSCEPVFETAIAPMERLFAQAASQGQTVLVASGDTGSEGCFGQVATDGTELAVQYPASDPSVTAVGGTVTPSSGPDVVWNACATATSSACSAGSGTETGPGILGASGGGVSAVFAEPSFQDQAGTFSGRAVPDVSADASDLVTYALGAWQISAGTSLSAPLVAGIVADVAPTYATRIGDLAPGLYNDVATAGYGHDLAAVTSGNNDWTDTYGHADYAASSTPGYNLATGLGTPIATGLLAPEVTSLSASGGTGGADLTVDGTNLNGATIEFGSQPATTVSATASAMTVAVPPGSGTVDVRARNALGSGSGVAFTYVPSFTSGATATTTAGSTFSFSVTTSGSANPTIAEAGPLPPGVTFTDNADGTATLAGTPAAGGTYPLTLSASDAGGTATQTFTLTVDEAPTFTTPASASFAAGAAGTFVPAATGYPAPTITLAPGSSLPSGITFSPASGGSPAELSGTTTSVGTYPLTFDASAGGTTTTQSFTLTIGSGPAFTTTSPGATFTAGTAGSVSLAATGTAPVHLSLSPAGVLPNGVSFTDNGDGTATLAGTPVSGSGGTYPLVVTATDAGGSATTEQLTLTVDEPPRLQGPTTATFGTGRPGAADLAADLGATGFPAPTVTTTSTLPTGLSLSSDGLLSGTPAAGTAGAYPITVTASNGVGAAATAAATITVDVPPTFTSAPAATFTEGEAGSFALSATGSPAPTFTETGSLPAGVTFSSNGVLSGSPTTSGSFSLILTAANDGGSLRQAFALTVQAATTTGGGTSVGGGGGAGVPISGAGGGGGGGGGAGGMPPAPSPVPPAPAPTPIASPSPPPTPPTAGPAPAQGPVEPPAPVTRAATSHARVLAGRAAVTVRCLRATCEGTITLFVGKRRVSGAKRYATHAGHVETVGVVLDRFGRARLARAGGHGVVVTERITVKGGRTVVRRIRLRLAPATRPATHLARVRRRRAALRVVCLHATCQGTITLLDGKQRMSRPKRYATHAGHAETVGVVLDRIGRARLAKASGRRIIVVEQITVKGGRTVVRRIELAR